MQSSGCLRQASLSASTGPRQSLSGPMPIWKRQCSPAALSSCLGRKHLSVRAQASSVGGLIHISESWIMAGSAALAVSVPVALGSIRMGKVQTVSPADAEILVRTGSNVRLVDVRSRLEVKIEGLPLKRHARQARVIHAPFNELRDGRLKPSAAFVDEVLFAPGVNQETTFVVLSSRGSDTCRRASKALAGVGTGHDIYQVEGGFRAWQAAGLDSESASYMGLDSMDGSALSDDDYDYYGGLGGPAAAAVRQRVAGGGPGSGGAAEEVLLDVEAGGLLGGLFRVPFKPKLLEVLAAGYTLADFQRDALAGLVVGVIALALGMALGIASDSTPAVGLYTVVVGGFLASALSGSRVTVVGPTAAFIPIVAGVAHTYGTAGLVACTGLAGLMLLVMGATGMGGIIRYVPKPVVTGFTAGIATYIFGTQVKDFLGLGAPGRLPEGVPIPTEFIEKVVYLGSHLDAAHAPSIAMGLGCLALLKAWPRAWAKVLPPPIVAIGAGTLGLMALQAAQPGVDWGIETIGSHFGEGAIPRSLPGITWPEGLSLSDLPGLLYPAATIALLAAIESLLCARVADTMIDDKHDSNTELISQGLANVACAAFGCLPATGALARTAANIRAGGRSPVSGLVHAVVVGAVILAAAPAAEYIPLPALSAVLVVVALNMGEWHNFTQLPKWPENDTQLFLVAFCLTVLQDVAVAVAFGMAIALAVFVQDVAATMHVRSLPAHSVVLPEDGLVDLDAADSADRAAAEPYRRRSSLRRSGPSEGVSEEEEEVEGPAGAAVGPLAASAGGLPRLVPPVVPAGVVYVEVTGSLLFGAGELLERTIERTHAQEPVRAVVLNMSHVNAVDVSGLELLEEAQRHLATAGKALVLCGLTRQPLRMMARAGFLDVAGRENVCRGVEAALRRAADIVAAQQAQEGPGNGNGSNGNGTKAKSVSRGATASKANAAAAANGNGNGSDVQAAHPAHQQQKGNGGLHGYGVAMASAELEDLWTSAAVPKAVSHVASGGRWDRLTGLRGGVPVEEGEGEGKAGVKGGKGAVGGFGGSVDGVAQREEEREV